MLRRDTNRVSPERITSDSKVHDLSADLVVSDVPYREAPRIGGLDIQTELNKLEEMILDSPRIPLSRRTLIDEEQLLDQLDLVRLSLPSVFHEAVEIVRHKEELLLEAEQYAQEIMESAQRQAAQMLDEMGLMRHAELEAKQLQQRVQQECDVVREQTLTEIDELRLQAQQEFERMRHQAIAECNEIQQGADDYADHVLSDMEQQLTEMIRVIRNGRQQLQREQMQTLPSANPNDPRSSSSPAPRSRK
jgi:cell division septum initiation protein DivIVA